MKGGRGATQGPVQVPIIGIGALIGAAICTAFASVYFEKMLKGASKPRFRCVTFSSQSIRASSPSSGCSAQTTKPSREMAGWLVHRHHVDVGHVASPRGIIVAVTIKYADNILRGFAQALALIIGAIGSWMIFDFTSPSCLPRAAPRHWRRLLHGSAQMQELCEALAGCNPVVEQGPSAAEVTSLTAATSDDTDPESAAEAGKAVPATRGAKEQVAES